MSARARIAANAMCEGRKTTATQPAGVAAKDRITGALRAPFVHCKRSAGAGEVKEEPRGRGLQRAVGELISCHIAWGHGARPRRFRMLFVPRTTRFFTSILGSVAISDFLQRAYAAAKKEGT